MEEPRQVNPFGFYLEALGGLQNLCCMLEVVPVHKQVIVEHWLSEHDADEDDQPPKGGGILTLEQQLASLIPAEERQRKNSGPDNDRTHIRQSLRCAADHAAEEQAQSQRHRHCYVNSVSNRIRGKHDITEADRLSLAEERRQIHTTVANALMYGQAEKEGKEDQKAKAVDAAAPLHSERLLLELHI